MSKHNVNITKRNGALGRRSPNQDGVCGLITTGVAIAGKLVLDTVYPMRSIRDAVSIGITAEYDSANAVLVHHVIDRFFKANPSGTLNVMIAAQTNTLADLVDPSKDLAKKLLRESQGLIKFCGVSRNPAAAYEPTLLNGLDADVLTAAAKAQSLYESEFNAFRYAGFLLEGRSFNGTAAAAKDLRTLNTPNVSITIAADPAISKANARYAGYAAVGDVLGLISKASVSQDIGELTSDFDLQDTGNSVFVTAGLSSGQEISTYSEADLDALDDKGYIFPTAIAGIAGFHLSDSHTASTLQNNDYAYIENNRTIEKAIFLVRQALLPKIKSRIKVDPATGYLEDDDVKALEATGAKALAGMETDGDISGGIDCYVNPEQDILSTSVLEIEVTFIPVSIAREITVAIGFSNPFKSN